MKRVLVVEDDDDIREMMSMVLELGGCQVVQAADGDQAMRLLHEGDLPSLVLLDMMMPQMSGADVLKVIRQDPRLQALLVVVISGDGRAAHVALRAGANAFLAKPVEAASLLELAQKLNGAEAPVRP